MLSCRVYAIRVLTIVAALGITGLFPSAHAAPGNGSGWGATRDKSATDATWSNSGPVDSGPLLSFETDRTSVAPGETVLLTWAALNVKGCAASGDWGGKQPDEGFYRTPPIETEKTYTLKCRAAGGGITKSISIAVVAPEPQQDPTPSEPVYTPEPVVVSLSASPLEVDYGGTTTLSWTTSGAESCAGVEGWGDNLGTAGTYTTAALNTGTTFTLNCTGPGGSDRQMVSISVLPPPEPTLKLSSSTPTVKSGEAITLTWTGENVSNCQATGAWTGTKPATGTELIGALSKDSTFTLSCQSQTGDVVAMTSVQISEGGTTLSWEPPKENVDGTPLSDLAAYRVYVGLSSRSYNAPIELPDPAMSSYFIELLPGDYYIAMTAVDVQGNESAYSNEVLKTVQ